MTSTRDIHLLWISLSLFVSATPLTQRANADAIVVTRAMQASTIAEVFIEPTQIRVELEVGAKDVKAFRNVLPDEIHKKITDRIEPLETRLPNFFASDWVMRADGHSLAGRINQVALAKRIVRDEVTGEPLNTQPDDAEIVVQIELLYPLIKQPETLTILSPGNDGNVAASIGFVCYHKGLPVNDFRYLPSEVTVDLDWSDPWYSRFRHPNLRRQFDAPLSAFLYIEPYEVRKEIIVRPKDLQKWIDLGLNEDGLIPVDQQEELKKRVVQFLSTKNSVIIDGKKATGRLDRIHFIHRTLRSTGIIEPPVDLDITSATLGIIFVYPIDVLPEKVSMEWELFSSKIQSIPTVASDEAGGLPSKVTPQDPVVVWKNYLTNPTNPQMVSIAKPPVQQKLKIPFVSSLCGIAFIFMLIVLGRRWSAGQGVSRTFVASTVASCVTLLATLPFWHVAIFNPLADQPVLSENSARKLLSGLLHNVYRSFDHHDESLIYDRLSHSIAGELLSDVYLETRKSMEVKNQGGMRISVKEVNITELEKADGDESASSFQCRWQVSGWVGHWGHIHARSNEHLAIFGVAPQDGRWKITAIEVLDEKSLDQGKTANNPLRKGGA